MTNNIADMWHDLREWLASHDPEEMLGVDWITDKMDELESENS